MQPRGERDVLLSPPNLQIWRDLSSLLVMPGKCVVKPVKLIMVIPMMGWRVSDLEY